MNSRRDDSSPNAAERRFDAVMMEVQLRSSQAVRYLREHSPEEPHKRSASTGEIRTARMAGNALAITAMSIKRSEIPMYVNGSVALTLKSSPERVRVSANVATTPIAIPVLARRTA